VSARRLGLATAALLLGCAPSQVGVDAVRVRVRARPGSDVDLASVTWSPNGAVRRVEYGPRELRLDVDRRGLSGPFVLGGNGLCPATVALEGAPLVELRPMLSASAGDAAELGFDAPFVITLAPGCREALAGKVLWKQIEGPPLETHVEQNGYVLRGRTRPFSEIHPDPVPAGIVPFSPRTRGQYAFRASFRGGGGSADVVVHIASAARSSGLPSIALGARVYLGGSGWHVVTAARNGHAEVVGSGGLETFRPDARGRWLLENDEHAELALVAGLHSETPLDCGRSECHAKETEAVKSSLMTSVLFRGMLGAFPDYDPSCAIGCHTAGEPGLADGGFDALRRELGLSSHFSTGPGAWDALPRALRRVGGVTCTACHGPGAIPEPRARWAVLRADVCAVCHDAPPRYGQFLAWKHTRMAVADRDPDARRKPECRSCHTTAGFLERQGVRKADPLAPDVALGISCAACHAPHGPHLAKRLLRDVTLTSGISLPASAGTSRICVACHAAEADAPIASTAATLVFGSSAGATPPHAEIGCTGCHGANRVHGEGHDFSVPKSTCKPCHEKGIPETPDLSVRARELFTRLGGRSSPGRPPHARASVRTATPPRAEALRKVLTVLEDPAAGVHNPAYAKALLDEAEVAM
jgi:Cytochrome c554 and c-prime